MGEFGKRTRQDRDNRDRREHRDRDSDKNQRRRNDNNYTSDDGEVIVYRILCPIRVMGSVIGRGGKVINSLRQETHAKIKVVDPSPGADKRVILIYCNVNDKDTDVDEDSTEPLCAAQDALLKVHAAIVDAMSNNRDNRDSDSDGSDKQEALLLAPSSQAANIIGKLGATIKRLRSKTNANIKVTPKDPNDIAHSYAMNFDNIVQISGEAEDVERALFAISAIMYKFSPRENISLDTTITEQLPPTIIIPSDVPFYPAGGFYPSSDALLNHSGSVGATTHLPEMHGYADSANWPAYSSSLPIVSGYGGPSKSEELTIRVLCPSDRIGRVIGKGGSIIKSVRQSSGASIDVDDKKVDNDQCIITITSTESNEDAKSAALEAVLLLQEKMDEGLEGDDDTIKFNLLVPKKIIGCLIGRNGSVVIDMRNKTRADIRISKGRKSNKRERDSSGDDRDISKGEKSNKRDSSFDELVEVSGEVHNVRDALVQIVLRLRKHALGDNDDTLNTPQVDSLYTSSLSAPQVLPSIPPVAPYGYDHRGDSERGLGMLSGSSLYGYSPLQAGEGGYGALSSYPSKVYGGAPSYIEVLIPANAVGKVVGRSGTNIENIKKISGAHIDIVDSKSSRSERIAQISGTPEQKRTAENLIQAFIMAT